MVGVLQAEEGMMMIMMVMAMVMMICADDDVDVEDDSSARLVPLCATEPGVQE